MSEGSSTIGKLKNTVTGSKKMLIILGVVIVGSITYSQFYEAEAPTIASSVANVPNDVTIQGKDEVTPAYGSALAEADKIRIEDAKKTGGSVIPTIVANKQETLLPVLNLDPPMEEVPEVVIPEVKAPIITQQPITPSIPIVQPPPAVRNPEAARELTTFMNSLRKTYEPAEVVTFSTAALEAQTADEQSAPEAPAAGENATGSKIKLPLPGSILYAEMVSRANSDAPGPVLARILQGEYTGATLIGQFQLAQNSLVISFNRMTVKTTRDGEEINETVPIETVAVDTTHIGTGLATSVDRHMFQKLAIGFTSSFARGFGDALSNNGSTRVVTDSGTSWETTSDLDTNEQLMSAGGEAVATAGEILMNEYGNRPTTVIVESGTAIGVLFL